MNPVDLPSSTEGNGWNEWSRFVLSELKRLNTVVEDLRDDVQDLKQESAKQNTNTRADIAALKVRAGLVGLAGGTIPAVGVLIWMILKATSG